MKKGINIIGVCLFFVLLLCPFVLTLISRGVVHKAIDVERYGYLEEYTFPEISMTNYLNGKFQEDFQKWWENNFSGRNFLTRTYNQIRYNAFGQGNENSGVEVGKEHVLFETAYIKEYLKMGDEYNYSLDDNRKSMENFVFELAQLDGKLKERGIDLVVYTTPAKADYCSEFFSKKYDGINNEGKRGIELFRELMAKQPQIMYLDGQKYIDEHLDSDIPVFYKTGSHWSRPAEQLITVELWNRIEEKNGLNNAISLTELKSSAKPYWRDADICDLLNLWKEDMDESYYEYTMDTSKMNHDESLSILLQGDSYGIGFCKDYYDNKLGDDLTYINYNLYYTQKNGDNIPISGFEDMDFDAMLKDLDVIIIQTTNYRIRAYSDGFVSYLNAYLDENRLQ